MKVSYLWLQSCFEKPLPPVAELSRKLTMYSTEVESVDPVQLANGSTDQVIDLKVLPSRPDLLSHRGIAREIAVLLDTPLQTEDTTLVRVDASIATPVVHLEDEERCPRYISRIIRGVKVGPSPQWLQDRLTAIGQRSINNVVDAANYLMFHIGQPLHAFDLDTLVMPVGGPAITIRRARAGEKMTTLDGKDLTLDESMLVIADEAKVLAIAGVKGGNKDAVTEKTTSLMLEAAAFTSGPTRKTARALGIATDASKRYENGVTPELAGEAMELLTALIFELAGGTAGPIADIYPKKAESFELATTARDITAMLGVSIENTTLEGILDRFQKYAKWGWRKEGNPKEQSSYDGERYVVQVPFERLDMRPRVGADDPYAGGVEADLIEEIGRVYGLENIPGTVPAPTERPAVLPIYFWSERLRNFFIERGFSEVMTYAFVTDKKEGSVEMQNPLAEDKKYLRTAIAPQLFSSLELNIGNKDLLGLQQVKIFEIGHVFKQGPTLPRGPEGTLRGERVHLAVAIEALDKKFDAQFAIESLISDLQHMFALHTLNYEVTKGTRHAVVEFDLQDIVDVLPAPEPGDLLPPQKEITTRFQPYSIYPFVVRDIAVWTTGEREVLAELLRKEAGDLLVRLNLFDEFTKDGKTSYAYRLVFQSLDRTLTGTEVDSIMQSIYDKVKAKGWTVR